MNPPSTLTQNRSGCLKPDEFLPLRRTGSEAPVSPRRKNRDPNWWHNPSPAQESLEDHFKAKKEVIDLKSNATTMAHAPFIEEGDTPDPAEDILSIDTCPSIIQCEQAPKNIPNVPAEIRIALVTVTNADESDEQEETAAAREYVPSSPKRSKWKPGQEETPAARKYAPSSPTLSNWKPASPVRQSRQATKETAVVDLDDSAGKIDEQDETSAAQKAATTTSMPIILMRPDDVLPLRSPPASPERKSRQAAKETVVVNTDEKHTVSRSIATDIDDSATSPSRSNRKPDAFRQWRRLSLATSSTSPSNKSKPQTEKATQKHTSLPAEVPIECFATEALDCSGIDDATIRVDEEEEQTIRDKAVCAEGLVENQSPAGKRRSSMNSLGHSSVDWEKPEWASEQRLKETGKAHFLKSEGNLAKPVAYHVDRGDGLNKEAQPGAVFKNKGVTTTEKNIEWEKPDWTKCRELKATGKADVLNSEGNLARPISLPVGSNYDAGTETVTNIAGEIRDRITQPFASRRKFC
jgi:hypothetical protein